MKTQILSFTSDIHKRSRSGNSLALRAKHFHILIHFSSALKEIHAVFLANHPVDAQFEAILCNCWAASFHSGVLINLAGKQGKQANNK